jgi:hypothetical protein
MDKDTKKDSKKHTDNKGHGIGNWNIFARFSYRATVAVAPYGLAVTHYCTSSNSAINL